MGSALCSSVDAATAVSVIGASASSPSANTGTQTAHSIAAVVITHTVLRERNFFCLIIRLLFFEICFITLYIRPPTDTHLYYKPFFVKSQAKFEIFT